MNIENYNHKIDESVKFHEVDLMGICNNAVYFSYFEDARIKYLQNLKNSYQLTEIMEKDSFFIMAHNECDYMEPALFDDDLIVYTRIDFIKNTSFGFRHIVENVKTKHIHARGGGVFVHINKRSKTPLPLPEEFYYAVKQYEKQVNILGNNKE
jgi:acyl-CoA thioester hydrolase